MRLTKCTHSTEVNYNSKSNKKIFLTILALLAVGAFGASSCDKGTGSQKSNTQTDKERLIESRKEQQEKRGELRDALKSGASEEEIEKRKNQVKEGQKAIVQDKKEIREARGSVEGSKRNQAR